jgi:fibronectin-binding autotransporter adhesin
MSRWIRQLFRSTPTSPVVKARRTTLGLQQLEERETPATFIVTTTADSGTGSLRAAVALANTTAGADTITFAAGLGPVVLTTAELLLNDVDTTTISGPIGGTQVVTRSDAGGTPNFRIFFVASGKSADFENLTISNGNVTGSGGGIFNAGDLEVTNSTISGNTASGGGGIDNDGTLTVTNSTISGNSANGGGGILNGGTLTLTNSTLSGNSANGGNAGGGIFHTAGTLTLANSTLSGNSADSNGGGILCNGTVTLTNVTMTGNRSDNNNNGGQTGGGLFRLGGTVTLNNTLIAGNFRGSGTTRDDVSGAVAGTSANNLIGVNTNLTGITNGSQGNLIGTGATPIDAKLGTLAFSGGVTQSIPLLAGSPAINAGSNTAATSAGLANDGRGGPFSRFSGAGGIVDIGAFEVQATPVALVVNNTGDADDGNYGAGQLSLREAVRLSANPGADTITFAAGLGPVTLTTAELILRDATGATTISGPSGGTQVVTRSTAGGTPQFRIFSLDPGASANFNNITISNGNAAGSFGGGILAFNLSTLTVTNSTVSGNTASFAGGGIDNRETLSVFDSTISGNASASFGGGIYSGKTLTVTNSTISGNKANFEGGGIRIEGSDTLTLTNVTITGNRSDNDNNGNQPGGGLSVGSGTVNLNNTLIAGNFRGTGTTRDDVAGAVAGTSSNNLIGDGTNLGGITNGSQGNLIGTGAAPIDPLLLPLVNNGGVTLTHALGQNSPALGAGSASVLDYSVFDQRGASRDVANGASPDIGAYEVNHPLAPVGVPTTVAGMFQPKPSASANEAFVKGLYQSTLLRAPDAAGLAGWLALLNSGTSRSTVANGFVNSIENRRAQVTFFYRYFLSREPDTAGLNGWVDILRGGTDEGQVMTGFILSNEFSGLNNNSQFVNLMYYALLSRQADTAGFNGWVNALNGGQSRGIVVNAFLRSEEGLNRVIDSLFQSYLKRYGSAGDLSAFRTYLATNTFGQAATLILSSPEYFTNAGNNLI